MLRTTRPFELKFASDVKPGSFSGYGAVFDNIDDGGDMIVKGAFADTLAAWKAKGKMPKMLWHHGLGMSAERPAADRLLDGDGGGRSRPEGRGPAHRPGYRPWPHPARRHDGRGDRRHVDYLLGRGEFLRQAGGRDLPLDQQARPVRSRPGAVGHERPGRHRGRQGVEDHQDDQRFRDLPAGCRRVFDCRRQGDCQRRLQSQSDPSGRGRDGEGAGGLRDRAASVFSP